MTAPLFNLPIASPVAGAAQPSTAQGPAAGFEALLAALFGATADGAEGALAGAETAADDKAPAIDDAAASPTDPTALPTDALSLAAMLVTQQPQQAATATETTPDGELPQAANPPKAVGPLFEAAVPATEGKEEATASEPQTTTITTPTITDGAEASPPAPVAQAKPTSGTVEPATDQSEQPDATADATTADALKTAQPERSAETKASTLPTQTPPPQARAQTAPAPPPASKPEAAPAAEAPAEIAAAAAEPLEEKPIASRHQRTAENGRRHAAGGVAAPHAPAADEPTLPTAVKPVAEAETTAKTAASIDVEPSAPTTQPAKAQAPDTPDFQAPVGPPTAAHASTAAPQVPASHATSETVANLTAAISKKLEGRATKFDVELTPAGLGHVNISVEIAASGKMTAAMSFDTPQAAAELRARSHELQKALEQAGFDIAGGLSFDVNGERGEGGRNLAQQQQQNDGAAWRGRAFQAVLGTAGEAAETATSAALQYARRTDTGVDIRI